MSPDFVLNDIGMHFILKKSLIDFQGEKMDFRWALIRMDISP